MSLFICAKCGCVDNTATSDYWALTMLVPKGVFDNLEIDPSLEMYKGEALCSECARVVFENRDGKEITKIVPGKWHGKFEKKPATDKEKADVGYKGKLP